MQQSPVIAPAARLSAAAPRRGQLLDKSLNSLPPLLPPLKLAIVLSLRPEGVKGLREGMLRLMLLLLVLPPIGPGVPGALDLEGVLMRVEGFGCGQWGLRQFRGGELVGHRSLNFG